MNEGKNIGLYPWNSSNLFSPTSIKILCCVLHVKEPSALIIGRKDLLWFYWFDQQHIALQHLVNHYIVLCKGIGLVLQNMYTFQSKNLGLLLSLLKYNCRKMGRTDASQQDNFDY